MLGLGKIWDGLRFIGKGFAKLFTVIHDIIPDEVEAAAIKAVEEAGFNYVSNTEKREWAVTEVMKTGIPESVARLAVEMAVTGIKNKLIPSTVE